MERDRGLSLRVGAFVLVALAALAAIVLSLSAEQNLQNGIVDAIIEEPVGGAHRDPALAAEHLQRWIVEQIRELRRQNPQTLVRLRYEKFRRLGALADKRV